MKINVTSIAVSITTLGIAVFGFSNTPSFLEVESAESGAVEIMETPISCGTPDEATAIQEPSPLNDVLLSFWVRGKYVHSVTPAVLKSAYSLDDIISEYPSKLIAEHLSVEIFSNSRGIDLKAVGKDVRFDKTQKDLLQSLQLGDEININVKFRSENPVTHKMEEGLMNYVLTIIPEQEAEYPGGYDELMHYLRETGANEITKEKIEQIKPCLLHFTVGETGEVDKVELRETSGMQEVDEILLRLARNMSPWIPAKRANGSAASQKFELHVLGMDGC